MIRILISLLILQATCGSVTKQARRDTRSITEQLASFFGKSGNYITVNYEDLPHFSDSIEVGHVQGQSHRYQIQYTNAVFEKLSSAYSLRYRIDLDANKVQLCLHLSKACIKGTYCASNSSSPSTLVYDFEVNLYVNLIYIYNIEFHLENGTVTFGKTDNHHLLYNEVKGKYVNPPSEEASFLESYLDPKLLEAAVAKIYQEVSAKVSLVDVGFLIKNEITFRQRKEIAGRFKKAIVDVFDDQSQSYFNIFYYTDRADFHQVIENYDVEVKAFVLRDVEGYGAVDVDICYVGEDLDIVAKAKFVIKSPKAFYKVVYRTHNDSLAHNKTLKAEYLLTNVTYEFELIAKPKTHTVELGNVRVFVQDFQVAPCQEVYRAERNIIINNLTPYVKSSFEDRVTNSFGLYIKGLLAERRVGQLIFK